jgi:hypothetical protein
VPGVVGAQLVEKVAEPLLIVPLPLRTTADVHELLL